MASTSHYFIINECLPHISANKCSAKYNNIISQINSTKINKYLQIINSLLLNDDTSKQFSRVKPGQSYIYQMVLLNHSFIFSKDTSQQLCCEKVKNMFWLSK